MKTIEINGKKRAEVGSKGANQLRREGNVPCVLYFKSQNVHFHMDARQLDKLIYTPDIFQIKLNIDGDQHDALMRDVQFHPVTDKAVHVDFEAVDAAKPVKTKLPVVLNGSSIGVRNGGNLRFTTKKLTVEGLLADLPDAIEIDITDLRIGQSIKIGSLTIPGVTFLGAAENIVVRVKTARNIIEEEEDEEEEGAEGAAEGAEGGDAEAKKEGSEAPAEEKKEEVPAES